MDGLNAGGEQLIALLVLAMSLAACGGLLLLQLGLMRCLASAPVLCPDASPSAGSATLTVVIPAYNEAVNIGPCLRHVLERSLPAATGGCWLSMMRPPMQRRSWRLPC